MAKGIHFQASSQKATDAVVAALNGGGTVIFPADTVYGMFGCVDSKESTERVYQMKKRPRSKPFGIYTNFDKVADVVHLNPKSQQLIKQIWPDALTLVLNKTANIPDFYTDSPTVGILTARNPMITEVISRVDRPIFGTTCNISGEPSIVQGTEARRFLEEADVLVEDDSLLVYKASSTMIDMTTEPPAIIRHGVVTVDRIEKTVGAVNVELFRLRS